MPVRHIENTLKVMSGVGPGSLALVSYLQDDHMLTTVVAAVLAFGGPIVVAWITRGSAAARETAREELRTAIETAVSVAVQSAVISLRTPLPAPAEKVAAQ